MSGRKELTRNTLWNVVNEVSILVSATLGVLLLIPRLGADDYGSYASLFALVGPFAAFAHGGVALTMYEHLVGERAEPRRVIGSCLSIALVVAAVLSPVCIVLAHVLFDALDLTTIVLFVSYEFFLQAIILTVIAATQASLDYGLGMMLRVVFQGVRISVMLVLAAFGTLTLEHLVYANFVTFAALTTAMVAVAPRLGLGRVVPRRIERAHVRTSSLYSLGVSGSLVQNDGDKVVLEAAGHRGDTGVYAAGYRLMMLAMIPLNAFSGSTHWAVLRSAHDETSQSKRAMKFTAISLVYAVPAAVVMFFAAPIVPHVLGDDFEGTEQVIKWLSPVVVLRGVGILPLNGLIGLGRTMARTGLLVGGAVVSMGYYLWLIPGGSWRGAAQATILAECTLLAASWLVLLRAQRRADEQHLAANPDADAEIELAHLTDVQEENF
ncbi:MAG: hypothetical protein KDB40_11150 [Acidimicrobiales bacterium]|nr:hypothetical protein [Acidimicrobiales bacterium]MCB9392322.1 hypothetical protein [Acidimicrobiaceae bacterium]